MFTSVAPAQPGPSAASDRTVGYGGEDRRREVATAFDPLYVGRFVWRWRWLCLLSAFAGVGLGAFVAFSTPKTFEAATQILLDPRDLKVVQNEVAPNALPSDATLALVESQTAVILSSRVLSVVIDKAGLETDPEFDGSERGLLARLLPLPEAQPVGPAERRARLEGALRQSLTVAREPKSFIINLSVTTQDPAKSARLANLFADAFIAEIARVQSDTARRATVAISSRLQELRQSVVRAESDVEDYKKRNSLIGVNGRLVDDEYITRLTSDLARARADLVAVRVRAESLKDAGIDDVVRGALPEGVASEALIRLRQGYSDLAQQVAILSSKLGTRHPQRIAVESALRSARDSIRTELARIVSAGQTELARAQSVERDLSAKVDELKAKQAETSSAFVKLRELEREVDASRAVYEAFLLRARETSEQESLSTANIRVISEAVPPLRPSNTSRKLVLAAGGIAGLLFGIGLLTGLGMLRLLVGFLRHDRRQRRADGDRSIWTEADRARYRAAQAEGGSAAPGQVPARADVGTDAAPAVFPVAPDGDSRAMLRDRVRALAAAVNESEASGYSSSALQREIQAVRQSLRDMRRGRVAS